MDSGRGRGRGQPLGPPPRPARPPPPTPGGVGRAMPRPAFRLPGRGIRPVQPNVDLPPPGRSVRSDVTTVADRLKEFEEFSISSPEASAEKSSEFVTPVSLFEETSDYYKGSLGKSIPVTSNFLELKIDTEGGKGFFEFEVRFEPVIDSRNERFDLISQLREDLPVRSFDGVKLYLPKMPAKTEYELTSKLTGNKVKASLFHKGTASFTSEAAIHFYNVLIMRLFRALKFTPHRRNYYDAVGKVDIRQHGIQIWPGYVTAVDRFRDRGLLLQIDVHHRVLRTENVRDLFLTLQRKSGSNAKDDIERTVIGTSVLTRYNNKTYRVESVDWNASPKSTFENAQGDKISYIDYYKTQYGLDIQDHGQPLLISKTKRKGLEDKDVERLVCLVPEFCMLTGMSDAMRADFRVMQDVAKITRVTPNQRREEIQKFLKRIHESAEAKELLAGWGLSLASTPISKLMARVLPPEKLFFGGGYTEMIGPKADWGRTTTSNKVLTPIKLQKWAMLFPMKHASDAQKFFSAMQSCARRMGIEIALPKRVELPNDRNESYITQLKELIDPSVQMVMCIVPQIKQDRYSAIKKICCVESPVASQVVVARTISNEKRLQSVAQKVVLQMNCKLGGELWGCQVPYENIMILGIDVFHETKDKSSTSPSIAGFVSSLNSSMSRFYSGVYRNKKGQEITNSLKTAFADALMQYHAVNNRMPDKIVVFRDGVGDGDMVAVIDHEIPQLLSVFESVKQENAPYNPGFNYVIVQKRINTRIFSFSGNNPSGGWENPPPGTILDHSVVRSKAISEFKGGKVVARAQYKDFFLVPQSVTQGTVSPTHYVVIGERNEHLGADDIQKLAYKLSHMYFNWPGTIRIPAPVQYAHKLVSLVGESVREIPDPSLAKTLYYL